MRFSDRETAPAVDHRGIIAESYRRNNLILHRGIAVDGLVDRRMEGDNFLNAAHVVTKAVDKRGVLAKERSKCGHIVAIPRFLELVSYFLGSFHRNDVNPPID